MEEKALIFDEKYISKDGFHNVKVPININKEDIKRIVLSNKESYGIKSAFKYYIGYMHESDPFLSSLYIRLPQMNAYTRYFDNNNKYINILVHDKEFLKKYNKIWDKIKTLFSATSLTSLQLL